MTSIINATPASDSRSNLLALVTAAELMTSEAKPRNLVDSSLSVVSASDDDEGMTNKLIALDNSDTAALSEDDDLTPRQPRAPPPKTQPGAPPPAPPPPPTMIRLASDNYTNSGTHADARVNGVVPTSPSGVVSGSSNSSSPVVLPHSSNNKPQSLPITLMNLLTNDDYHEILSFLPHGKCFLIKHTKEFTKKLMQQHFHLSKFGSFVSRLQRWGFAHLQDSILPGQHAFYHPLFQKGKWEPLGKMMYQAKSTKALKNKLTKSMKSRAELNQLRTTAVGRNNVNTTATNSFNNTRLLGDLAAVSQSTVNHATQNIVDAAIACLRRDQELLSMPRLAKPDTNSNRNVFPPSTPVIKNTMMAAPAPSRVASRSTMEPMPPIPPVPTNHYRPSFGAPAMVGRMATAGGGMQGNASPTIYPDGLLRSATSQMMLWKQQQQPGGYQMMERPSSMIIPHGSQMRPESIMDHQSARPAPRVNVGGGGVPTMGAFRGNLYFNKPLAQEDLMMPHHPQHFAPVNSFFP